MSTSVERRVQPTAHPRAPLGRLAEVQGLRALAVLLVVAYHSGLPVPGGFVGVDVFFVISGFVIARMLIAEARLSGRIDLVNFYRRRIRRLVPVAAVVLTATLLGSLLLQSPVGAQGSTALTAIGASTWSANGFLFVLTHGYFGVNLHAVPLLHTWSLSVEEQFYLVFPALLAGCALVAGGRARRFARLVVAVGVTGLVVSFVINLWLMFGDTGLPASAGLAYFSPMSRAWEFAAGALLCFIPAGSGDSRRAPALLGLAGLTLIVASAFLIESTDPFPGYLAIGPVLGAVLLIVTIGRGTTAVSRALSSRAAQRLGDLSYGWYLWHWPLIVFVQVLWPGHALAMGLAAAAALWLATLTYRAVEQPFRAGPADVAGSTRRLLAICLGVPIALAIVLLLGSRESWGNDAVRQLSSQVTPKPLNSDVCLSDTPLRERDFTHCTFGRAGGAPVLLVGDSNAAQYTDGMARASEAAGHELRVATVQGCPLDDVVGELDGSTIDRCHDAYRASIAWLREQPRSLVVLAAAGVWVDMDGVRLVDPDRGTAAADRAGKGELWEAGLIRTYRALQSMGHEVVHVSSVPFFASGPDRTWEASTCSLLTTLRDSAGCGEAMTRDHADEMQRHVLAAEDGAARATGVRVLDLRSAICRHDTCATNVGETWVYRDGMHLAVSESLRLAPLFETILRAVWPPRDREELTRPAGDREAAGSSSGQQDETATTQRRTGAPADQGDGSSRSPEPGQRDPKPEPPHLAPPAEGDALLELPKVGPAPTLLPPLPNVLD